MPNRVLIYEAVIECLKDASSCSARISSSPEFPPNRPTSDELDEYLISMASQDAVSAIVESLECRKTLLEVSSKLGLANDPNLRAAWRKDGERIAALLVSICVSESLEEAALLLEGDSAQHFLDVVQSTLDKGFLMDQEHSRMARRMIRKLSASCDILPSSIFVTGVTGKDQFLTFGGGYADVYRASYGSQIVALKCIRHVHLLRGSDLRRIRLKFCREALIWKQLNHPHVLPFLGIDGDSFPSSLGIVAPWMEHGTVMNYLKEHGRGTVDKLLSEIAEGLQYLHSSGIVHGDLRGSNILINEDLSACLADFGLSIFSDATTSLSTGRAGSVYWMAPELLDPAEDKFARTPASDIYAFGCVCLELYTGYPPFANLPEPGAAIKVIDGERPERPSGPYEMADVLWQHVTACWSESPSARPVIAWFLPTPERKIPPRLTKLQDFLLHFLGASTASTVGSTALSPTALFFIESTVLTPTIAFVVESTVSTPLISFSTDLLKISSREFRIKWSSGPGIPGRSATPIQFSFWLASCVNVMPSTLVAFFEAVLIAHLPEDRFANSHELTGVWERTRSWEDYLSKQRDKHPIAALIRVGDTIGRFVIENSIDLYSTAQLLVGSSVIFFGWMFATLVHRFLPDERPRRARKLAKSRKIRSDGVHGRHSGD